MTQKERHLFCRGLAIISDRYRSMLKKILQKIYGNFSKDELIHTLLLGTAFALIIGTYWTLRPLKDALFKATVIGDGNNTDASPLAWAKILSISVLVPIIIFYSYLVDKVKRQSLFYLIGGFFVGALFIFSLLFVHPVIGLANKIAGPERLIGWCWYVFVEVYGSLLIALFWAYASEVTNAQFAKLAFPMIVMFGQFGGIFGPQTTDLPSLMGFSNCAPLIAGCAISTIVVLIIIRQFAKRLERHALPQIMEAKNCTDDEKKKGTGFVEGIRLLFTDRYLLGIFLVVAFFEII
ncbi:MAG: hypothetical protein EOM73_13535, partial [Bacteroidia bacterium]|nr:hypothetical protein [Bacteroidia bacterium]